MNQENFSALQRSLMIMFIAVLAGILVFAVISVIINIQNGAFIQPGTKQLNWILWISIFVTLVILYVARYIYNRKLEALQDTIANHSERMGIIRYAYIRHYALCEVPALLGVICFLVFGNASFFILVAMALIELTRKFPSRDSINQLSGTAY